MVELLLKRYFWLIDTLKRNGEMTFDEIADRWEESSLNDNSSVLTKRTFYNHCQAVAQHFGIDIECRRGYLRSLTIHNSQRELSTSNEHTDFSLRLIPIFDFIQELLLHRDQLEVLSPQSLRDEIQEIITKMKNRYDE